MSYGLKIYDNQGRLRLDGTEKLSRLRESFYINQGASGSHLLSFVPDWSKCCIMAKSLTGAMSHVCTENGNYVDYTVIDDRYIQTGPTLVSIIEYR